MGLLSWLRGSNASGLQLLPDRVWLNEEAKFRGLIRELEAQRKAANSSLLQPIVAHFPESLRRFQQSAEFWGVDLSHWALLTSDQLESFTPFSSSAPKPSETLTVAVLERHPLSDEDERVQRFAEMLPCDCRVVFHLSLQDALLQMFVGDGTLELLRKMGMREEEAISSNLLSRRIRAAQAKVRRSLPNPATARPAQSAHQWLDINLSRI